MSEKRFTFDYEVEFEIFDRVTKKHYDGTVGCQEKICDLLNEQQKEIEEQNKQIEEWEFSFRTEMAHHRVAEKELQEKIREKQATINKLNDELELTANTKLYSRRELERKVDEQQAEIERLQKIIDLTQYQLKNKLNKGL